MQWAPLSSPAASPTRFGEGQAHHGYWITASAAPGAGEGKLLQARQRPDRPVMGPFRVQAEQDAPRQWIGPSTQLF